MSTPFSSRTTDVIIWETLKFSLKAKITPMEQILYMYFVFSIKCHIKWWFSIVVPYMDMNRKTNAFKFIPAKRFPLFKKIKKIEAISNGGTLGFVSWCSHLRQRRVMWRTHTQQAIRYSDQRGSSNWRGCHHPRSRSVSGIVEINQIITVIQIDVFYSSGGSPSGYNADGRGLAPHTQP